MWIREVRIQPHPSRTFKNTISQYEFSQTLAALQNSHSPSQQRGPLMTFQTDTKTPSFIKLTLPAYHNFFQAFSMKD